MAGMPCVFGTWISGAFAIFPELSQLFHRIARVTLVICYLCCDLWRVMFNGVSTFDGVQRLRATTK